MSTWSYTNKGKALVYRKDLFKKKKNIKKKQNILTEEIFMGGEKGLRKF